MQRRRMTVGKCGLKNVFVFFVHLQPADPRGALDEARRRRQRQEGLQRSPPRHLEQYGLSWH